MATRDSIIDAAELLFERQGVSRTTLQDIAAAAGVTRGAIYWHFKDKADLFNAMMDRATLPLETALECTDSAGLADPIGDVRTWLMTAFRLTVTDPTARRVFEIATHKVEYVEELTAVRDRHLANYNEWLARSEKRLRLAMRRGMLKPGISARVTALGLWATADGLIRLWLLNPKAFDLQRVGRQVLDTQLAALRQVADDA